MRIKRKGIVYCLKSINKEDGIFLYKVGCCKRENLMARKYYWNRKIKTKFDIFKVYHSQDIYKDEKDIQLKLHSENYGMVGFGLSSELFGDFNNDLEDYMENLFYRYMFPGVNIK